MIRRSALLLLTTLALAGCDGSNAPSLDAFKQDWYDAVNNRKAEKLYDMLDSASRRAEAEELYRLRGLPAEAQKQVIDQLGGERVDSLVEIEPRRYFALKWRRATEDRRPRMKIELEGATSAYMLLSLEGRPTQRIRLSVEGDRWVWHLPELPNVAPPPGDGAVPSPPPANP